jgi:DNA-binding HxlR family transcriptional regulator
MATGTHDRDAYRLDGGLDRALSEVGDRWTLLVVAVLLEAPQRFGDLERALPGIASNVLSDRLKRLERHGLALAQPYSERPRRFVYELTAAGRELAGAVRMLTDWGARRADDAEPARHSVCGTDLEARWYCPTCARAVEDREAEDLQFA